MTAYSHKTQVFITDVSTYLGTELAKSFLIANCAVTGQGSSHLTKSLLINHDFTLLEIDLSQPLPAYLPKFDIIFDLSLLVRSNQKEITHIPPQLRNVIAHAKNTASKIFILVPIETSNDTYDYLVGNDPDLKDKVEMVLTGDVYGPGMPLMKSESTLANMIWQAVKSDKVILENEGLDHIYPTYITDAIFALNKFAFAKTGKKIHHIASESAKTTLTAAYEIQDVMRLVGQKEVGLFFAGLASETLVKDAQHEAVVRIHETGLTPKVDFKEGLKYTVEFFASNGQVHQASEAPVMQSTTHQQPPHFVKVQETKTSYLPKLPTANFNPSFKNLALFAIFLLILTIAKTGFDLYLGQNNLKMAQQNLIAGDFKEAGQKAQSAKKSFHAAANKIKLLTLPISPLISTTAKSLNNALLAAETSANAAYYFVQGSEVLATDFGLIANPDVKNEGFDLELASANFKKSYQLSSQAAYLLEGAANLPLNNKIETAKVELENMHLLSQRAYELTNLTDDFIGSGAKKTYLVLFQNNTELRPGGGFIGNFALIEFDEGKLKNISVEDIYTIDGQLKEEIDPPEQLTEKLGIKNLYLRDSNWSADFELNAQIAKDLFKKETGKDIDGVIAIDLNLVQNILAKMGPIMLSDYDEEITAENLFERGEYYSEVGFFPGSTQKRDFFGALTRTMVAKILASLKAQNDPVSKSSNETGSLPLPWLALIEGAAQGLPQKHLMLTFSDPTLSAYIRTKGYNHPLPPIYFNPADDSTETRDFVALSEANLGANKVNRFLDRKVAYEMTIGKDADLVGKLTVTYTNNSQAETWPAGEYVNYLRVYLPFASSLFEYQNGQSTDIKEVQGINQGSLTVLSTYVEVPINSTKVVSFTYRIPKNIKLETAPTYSVYFQKQAGTDKDPLEFKFNLPAYLSIENVTPPSCHSRLDRESSCQDFTGAQNITIQTDLLTDRKFEIEVAKR